MNEDRRRTILREIDHWRRSKLLPDQYCDFLRNLYIEDDEPDYPSSGWAGKTAHIIGTSSGKQWFLAFGVFSLICLVVLYFNAFHPLLQTALTLSTVVGLLYYGLRLRRRSEPRGLASVGAGMLLLLGTGFYMLQLHGFDTLLWSAAFLTIIGLFWIVFGIAARIPALHFCGWAAIILVYTLLLGRSEEAPAWYEVQLFWVPAAFVFGWCSWFVHRWSKPSSAVLFVTGALLWFMPEIHTALLLEEQTWIQTQLIAKIACGGAVIFALRKKWIAWVA